MVPGQPRDRKCDVAAAQGERQRRSSHHRPARAQSTCTCGAGSVTSAIALAHTWRIVIADVQAREGGRRRKALLSPPPAID